MGRNPNNTVPTLIVDKNGKLTTVHKGVHTSPVNRAYRPASSMSSPNSSAHWTTERAANEVLDQIADMEDQIAIMAVGGLINVVQADYPEASTIVLESDNDTGKYQVAYVKDKYGEPLLDDEADLYNMFAARIDVEGSLVTPTEYADRFEINWERG